MPYDNKFKTCNFSGLGRGNTCLGLDQRVRWPSTVAVIGLAAAIVISAIALSVAALVVSWKQRSFVVAGLLAASGIILMIPAIIATGYFAVIVFPGPILGVIFGLVIFGLGVAKGIRTASMATLTV
ncbi:MAG TPA: hypothetical protein VFH09_01380 [Nitrososphaera sp.]|nr:hypothetical protein [Nitrososphaera sp.]